MADSYKNGFEFVVVLNADSKYLMLKRRNGTMCFCPFDCDANTGCGSHCPHFVIENCDIVNKKCQLILTCGKYTARYLEIIG